MLADDRRAALAAPSASRYTVWVKRLFPGVNLFDLQAVGSVSLLIVVGALGSQGCDSEKSDPEISESRSSNSKAVAPEGASTFGSSGAGAVLERSPDTSVAPTVSATQARAKLAKAEKLRASGESAPAQIVYLEALMAFRRLKQPLGMANSLLGLGTLQRKQGNVSEARVAYGEAGTIFRKLKNPLGEALALRGLGELELEVKQAKKARRAFAQAGALFNAVGDGLREAAVSQRLAEVERMEGRAKSAAAAYTHAADIYKRLNEPKREKNARKAALAVSQILPNKKK